MYCKQCGTKYITDEAAICVNCGAPKGAGNNYCHYCGEALQPNSTVCTKCGVATNSAPVYVGGEQKSKLAAGLLGIFLGGLGIHNFYLGFTTKAIIQLLVCIIGGIVTCGIAAIGIEIWGLVEGILILTGSINVDAKGVPLKD